MLLVTGLVYQIPAQRYVQGRWFNYSKPVPHSLFLHSIGMCCSYASVQDLANIKLYVQHKVQAGHCKKTSNLEAELDHHRRAYNLDFIGWPGLMLVTG